MERTEKNIKTVFEKRGVADAEVTVIITLYNYEHLVEETLDSVFNQTLRPLDLVIAEDHATDRSLEVAEKWLRKHEQRFNSIKLLHHRENQGLGKTRNTAFHFADTPFVFVLDADNLLYPKALEKMLRGLKNSACDFVFCYLEHFGDVRRIGGLQPWQPEMLQYGNTIDAMVLMKKEMWQSVGGYSEDMPYNGWEDYELWVKIAKASGKGVRIPEILCRYRVHFDSMLHSETNKKVEILREYLHKKHSQFFVNN